MPVDKDFDSQERDIPMNLGKCWAALRDDKVLAIIAMRVPGDVDFEDFRLKAAQCLELLGEVKSGELIERDGERYFLRRPAHANRGKKVREPIEYPIYQPRHPL
tara:strand:- start:14886 stop:15197 length:312 start_codon:yes stop_codon:yes gene_type:complete